VCAFRSVRFHAATTMVIVGDRISPTFAFSFFYEWLYDTTPTELRVSVRFYVRPHSFKRIRYLSISFCRVRKTPDSNPTDSVAYSTDVENALQSVTGFLDDNIMTTPRSEIADSVLGNRNHTSVWRGIYLCPR